VAALFAAQLNSGINAAWVLIFLSVNPAWMDRARAEVLSAIERNSTTSDKEAPLLERLASLPFEAWETDFPVLDWCLRDCIRLTATGATFRRNISGADIVVGNEVIPKDAYVVCTYLCLQL
jgi:sterol 14-demethylase